MHVSTVNGAVAAPPITTEIELKPANICCFNVSIASERILIWKAGEIGKEVETAQILISSGRIDSKGNLVT
jgi:hypothetical protein